MPNNWPADTKYISHSTLRIDAPPKLTGSARYSSDIQAAGWLYGMISAQSGRRQKFCR
jgi:CO/xanthine dehydrogenase Mo-binding subunit